MSSNPRPTPEAASQPARPEPAPDVNHDASSRPLALLAMAVHAYTIMALLLLLLVVTYGERASVTNLLLYVPPLCWMLAPLLLVPAIWVRKHYAIHAAVLLMALTWTFVPIGLAPSKSTSPRLVISTNNSGQRPSRTLMPFLGREKPDIMAFQGTGVDALNYAELIAGAFVHVNGEFVLISSYPIAAAQTLSPVPDTLPVAIRYELDMAGDALVLYNVHLPTPRSEFTSLHAADGNVWERYQQYHEVRQARVEASDYVLRHILEENNPEVVVVGDFNVPPRGYLYRQLSEPLTDCFAAVGRGRGYTFPANSPNKLWQRIGPWLRLDYVFCGPSWQPVYCRVEESNTPQHRCVVAGLAPRVSLP